MQSQKSVKGQSAHKNIWNITLRCGTTNLITHNTIKQNINRTPKTQMYEDAKIFIRPLSKDKTDIRAIHNAQNTVNENNCTSWTNFVHPYHLRNMKDV